MKNIEKRLLAYYREQTETAPVISGTRYKATAKAWSFSNRRWLKAMACAALALAIGIGFLGTDYQSFFTPPALTPPAILDDESKEVQNDNTTDNEQSAPEASVDDSSFGGTEDSNVPEHDISIDDTPIDNESNDDTSTPSNVEEPTPPPQTIYADFIDSLPLAQGDKTITMARLLNGVQALYENSEMVNGKYQYKGNEDDLFYVAIKPSSIEKQWIGLGREVPKTWKEYKEIYGWIIEAEQKMFESLGIDATLYWFEFHLPDGNPGDKYYLHEAEVLICPDEEQPTENIGYFYTAYIKPQTLFNYDSLADQEHYRTVSAMVEKLAPIDAWFYNLSKYDNIDYSEDLAVYFPGTGNLYFEKGEADESKHIGFDTDGDGIKDVFNNHNFIIPDCTAVEQSEIIREKWIKYVKEGVRPSIFCGGEIVHLTKEDSEKDAVLELLKSDFGPVVFTCGVSRSY